ncbi:MAG: amidase family protein [Myxococcales bacterium]
MRIVDASIDDLQTLMAEGRASARSLVETYLARIEEFDQRGPSLNAVRLISPSAMREADALDKERAENGPRGPIHGIPILVKDNMDVAGMPTTAGSRALDGLIASQDAFVVAKLRAAGAVIMGKTNLHEFAAGITTTGSAHGQTRNPYDLSRNPGGSSGGTGAAIAADLAVFGTGSDTCGSIRIPAAQNSLVGLRPTQGLTSLSGIVPLCMRQDVAGPIARSVRDLAYGLDVMVGEDEADPGTLVANGRIPEFVTSLGSVSLSKCRIGRLDTLFGSEPEDEAIASIIRDTLERLESFGAEIVPVHLPELVPMLDVGFAVLLAEFPTDLETYLAGCPTAAVKSLADVLATGRVHADVAPIMQAAVDVKFRETPAYERAIANRGRIRRLLETAIRDQGLDALAYPSILRVAAPIGAPQEGSNAYASADSGLPAISLPGGYDSDGHPVGLEMLGAAFADAHLVSLAAAIETALPIRRPPSTTPELA